MNIKVKLLKPQSTDAGTYTGIDKETFKWGTPVEAKYCSSNKGIYVKGEVFIELGGDENCFVKDREYLWGSYEEVE